MKLISFKNELFKSAPETRGSPLGRQQHLAIFSTGLSADFLEKLAEIVGHLATGCKVAKHLDHACLSLCLCNVL